MNFRNAWERQYALIKGKLQECLGKAMSFDWGLIPECMGWAICFDWGLIPECFKRQ